MAVRELELPAHPAGVDATPAPRGLFAKLLHRLTYPFRRGVRPAQQPPTGFYTDTTVCIGCKACEVACKQWNQLPADGFTFTGNSYDNTGALTGDTWRHVKFIEQFTTPEPVAPAPQRFPLEVVTAPVSQPPVDFGRWLMMSDVCKHCAAAPCQQACPTGSIVYTEFANVYIQPDICNGCAYCVAACPFGVITRSHFDGHSHKCTLCYDRQRDGLVPACAKACPTASIQFGPVSELRERAQNRVEQLKAKGVPAYLYGAEATETYTELHSFYLLTDRPEVYGLPADPVNPWLHMRGDYLRSALAGLVGLVALLLAFLLGG
ncbi:4Fe-4S dicluster domain-containing protein [Gemmata sp. JC673]|uniref:4Fe-4S dicluster domain-containing protein n=1 Tax=Gemmata algarum TaxID=2975278 RepID=A0ABU5ET27_9BACT|nr:4Fe-4S dicluster domain-containing protein [Gemmata algarum]MDY3557625.1 4Fe-4S dicluster domain-containing protein [Gemmata algarum]